MESEQLEHSSSRVFGTRLYTNAASCQGDLLRSALSHHLCVGKAAEANTLGDTKETKLRGKQIHGLIVSSDLLQAQAANTRKYFSDQNYLGWPLIPKRGCFFNHR